MQVCCIECTTTAIRAGVNLAEEGNRVAKESFDLVSVQCHLWRILET